jgi:MFS family permease
MRIFKHMAGDMQTVLRRLWPLIIMAFLAEWGYAIMNVAALPVYVRAPQSRGGLGAPADLIGFLITTFLVSETFFKPLFGWAGDRFGRKQFIVTGLFVSAITPLLMGLAKQTWVFFPIRALDGVGAAAIWPCVLASVAALTHAKERTDAMTLFNMMYMIGLGLALPSYSLVFQLTHRHQNVFWVISGVFLTAALIAWLSVPQTKDPQHAGENLAASGPETALGEPIGWRETLELAAKSRILLAVMLGSILQATGTNLLNGVIIIYANEVLGIHPESVGKIFIGPALVVLLLAIPVGSFGGKWGKIKSVRLGLFTSCLAFLLIPQADNWIMFSVIVVPQVLGFLLATPSWLALITEMAPPGKQGTIVGAVATAQGVGAMIGPALGGWLYEHVKVTAPFYVASAFLAAALVIAWREFHEGMKVELPNST